MTKLLEQAIEKIRDLSEVDQDALASLIMQEIADERRWDTAFARSQDKLAAMAEKARRDLQ